jgi:hypothetical protein
MAAPPASVVAPVRQNIQQVLNDHDCAKRSTDIPLFYAQPGRDTIAAHLFIICVNDAGAITGWDNACKLLEFKMCLRDKALGWFILGKCIQDVVEDVEFVSEAGSAYFCDFFYLGAKLLRPFF